MKQLKQFTIIGIIFVLIAGSLAHFAYDPGYRFPGGIIIAVIYPSIVCISSQVPG